MNRHNWVGGGYAGDNTCTQCEANDLDEGIDVDGECPIVPIARIPGDPTEADLLRDTVAERDHQLELLATVLGEILVAAKHIQPGFSLSGPQLLQFGTELRDSLTAGGAHAEVERLTAACAANIRARDEAIAEGRRYMGQAAERDALLRDINNAGPLWRHMDSLAIRVDAVLHGNTEQAAPVKTFRQEMAELDGDAGNPHWPCSSAEELADFETWRKEKKS